MRGTILTVDRKTGRGLLRAADDRRYGFEIDEWRDEGLPAKGDKVDFELVDGRPRDMLLLTRAAIGSGGFPGLRRIVDRLRAEPILLWSALAALAALAPAYGFAGESASLLSIQTHIVALSSEIDRLRVSLGLRPDAATMAGAVKAMLGLMPLVLLAPALGALSFWRVAAGEEDRQLARVAGICAALLPVGIPLVIAVTVYMALLLGLPQGLRAQAAGSPFAFAGLSILRFVGVGSLLMTVSGIMLWRAASARGARRRGAVTMSRRENPADFAPPPRADVYGDLPRRAESHDGEDPIPALFRRRAGPPPQGTPAPPTRSPAGAHPQAERQVRRVRQVARPAPQPAPDPQQGEFPEDMLPPEPLRPDPVRRSEIAWPPPESRSAPEIPQSPPRPERRQESERQESERQESGAREPARQEPSRQEPDRLEPEAPPHREPAYREAPPSEPSRPEPPRSEPPRSEPSRAGQSRTPEPAPLRDYEPPEFHPREPDPEPLVTRRPVSERHPAPPPAPREPEPPRRDPDEIEDLRARYRYDPPGYGEPRRADDRHAPRARDERDGPEDWRQSPPPPPPPRVPPPPPPPPPLPESSVVRLYEKLRAERMRKIRDGE
ncbi:MAG: hypothetical protein AB7L41_13060 [Flavobacteriaceae bacterium]